MPSNLELPPDNPTTAELENALLGLEDVSNRVIEASQTLMKSCNGSIFPCDALAVTATARSIALIHGFVLLAKGGNYQCAAGVARFQMDNVLRLFGVMSCKDPHGVASDVLTGTPLNKIKHDSGDRMFDGYLVKLLGEKNPWIPDAYKILSGFIHLSDQHFDLVLMQSIKKADGVRDFHVSDTDEYIPMEHKVKLINAFESVTNGVTKLVEQWTAKRKEYGGEEQLKVRFGQHV